MPSHLILYLGLVVAIALLPGPDTTVVTRNALVHGREAALGSALGINIGLVVWTGATALGVAAVLRSSATLYDALKLAGAIYLVWLGARTLWQSRRVSAGPASAALTVRAVSARAGLRQGVLSNLSNPKVGIFFTSLLPQFVSPHAPAGPQLVLLGGIFIVFNLSWMASYALAAVRLSGLLSRTRVKATIDRVSGLVLVGVGLGLALDR